MPGPTVHGIKTITKLLWRTIALGATDSQPLLALGFYMRLRYKYYSERGRFALAQIALVRADVRHRSTDARGDLT